MNLHSIVPEYILATSEKTIHRINPMDFSIRDWLALKADLEILSKEVGTCIVTLNEIATHTLLLAASLPDME